MVEAGSVDRYEPLQIYGRLARPLSRQALPMTTGNLFTALDAGMAAAGDKAAFVPPTGKGLTYAQLRAVTGRLANTLVALGVQPGDRVMVQAEKSITSVCLYLAVLKVGAVYNPLNTAYTTAELDYFRVNGTGPAAEGP